VQKYEPLHPLLCQDGQDVVTVDFGELDGLLA
jgi:hypothetical protein